jgi:hypothetical protein
MWNPQLQLPALLMESSMKLGLKYPPITLARPGMVCWHLGYFVCLFSLSHYQTVSQCIVMHHSCLIPPLEKAIVLVIQWYIFSTQCYSSSVPYHRIYNVELKKWTPEVHRAVLILALSCFARPSVHKRTLAHVFSISVYSSYVSSSNLKIYQW